MAQLTGQREQREEQLATYATVFTYAKAGMEEVDKERVKRIVYEMSKVRQLAGAHVPAMRAGKRRRPRLRSAAHQRAGAAAPQAAAPRRPPPPALPTLPQDSAHFKNEQRKAEAAQAKIAAMQQAAARLGQAELAGLERALQQRVAALEAWRDLSRTWLVADMDSFRP
jgi:hypothetical protein